MTQKNILIGLSLIVVLGLFGYFFFYGNSSEDLNSDNFDATPQNVTLSGTYVCLPHLDTTGPQTMECAFGLQADDGLYYAVDFGSSGGGVEQFVSGVHITAEGFVVIKEALSSDHWNKYNMEGVFTITKIKDFSSVSGKLNINVVCEGALAYMTFPDGESAEKFVAECKEGKHPEVIEKYKKDMNLGEGVAI